MRIHGLMVPIAVLTALATSACDGNMMSAEPLTELAAVIPTGGAVDVSVHTNVTIQFTHPMMAGMEAYVALQEGDPTGPVVHGSWAWSQDRTSLAFTPAEPLRAHTRYTIHVGGGMMDANGGPLGFEQHGGRMGGLWANTQMMSGGWGPSMMGTGWRHANGSYGMVFSFTTA